MHVSYPTSALFSSFIWQKLSLNQRTLEEMTGVQVQIKLKFMKSFGSWGRLRVLGSILCLELPWCQEQCCFKDPFPTPAPPHNWNVSG